MSAITTAAIAQAGLELVEHALYSRDLSFSDYQLFPKLKELLWFFWEALEMLENRWEKCVNLNWEYVEK